MPPDWLTQADERILEYLDEQNTASAEMVFKDNRIDLNQNYITQRRVILYNARLLEKTARGVYRISPKGQEYFSGDAGLRDEPKPDPE